MPLAFVITLLCGYMGNCYFICILRRPLTLAVAAVTFNVCIIALPEKLPPPDHPLSDTAINPSPKKHQDTYLDDKKAEGGAISHRHCSAMLLLLASLSHIILGLDVRLGVV